MTFRLRSLLQPTGPARNVVRAVTALATAGGLWFSLREVSAPELAQAFALTDLSRVLGFGLPLLVLGSLARTARYGALLPAVEKQPRFFELWSSVILSTAGNYILPLKGGELFRTRETVAAGVPLAGVAVAQVTEKVIETLSLFSVAMPLLASRLSYCRPAVTVAGLIVVGVALTKMVARRFRVGARQFALSLGWSAASDAIEIGVVAACLAGLGLPSGLLPCAMVYVAVNVATALPLTPGNLGTFEAGAALPLVALGVGHDAAVAFALVYRAIQWLPVTFAGAALWVRRAVLRRSTHAEAWRPGKLRSGQALPDGSS